MGLKSVRRAGLTFNWAGVYLITNRTENKFYVGSSIGLRNRFRAHRGLLKRGVHWNPGLQRAYNLGHRLIFQVLEIVKKPTAQKLAAAEQKFIDSYISYKRDFGYNKLRYAYTKLGMKHSDKTREKIRYAKLKSLERPTRGKTWFLITPAGEKIVVQNLSLWCEENNLGKTTHFQHLFNKKNPKISHKGYKPWHL